MITDTLISDEIWADAPEDAERAFLFIAQAAYDRLKLIESDPNIQAPHSLADWRKQYVYELATVAHELGIEGLMSPETALQSSAHLNQFDAHLARVITRIKASLRAELRAESVALSFQTKSDIRRHLEELRDKINKSNLSDELRAALHKRVDAVEAELEKARSSLTVFWKLAGAMTLASTIVSTTADLPDALKTTQELVQLVHEDKAAEETNRDRLSHPQLTGPAALKITDQSSKTKAKP